MGYVEWNFGLPPIDSDYDSWEYADVNAPDWQNDYHTPPLSDFFPLPIGQGRSFTTISTPYSYTCFTEHTGTNCPLASGWVATDPDSD